MVGVPNLSSYYNRLLLLLGMHPTCIDLEGAHVRAFSKSGYIKFLNACIASDYKILDFKGANFVPFPNKLAKALAKIFPNFSTCIFFLIRKESDYDNQFLEKTRGLETPYWVGK